VFACAAAAGRDVFDFAAAVPGIGLLAGRLGNFINGELWGKPTDVPWGFAGRRRQVRHATQLYEAALEGVVLFAVLWWFTSTAAAALAPSGLFLAATGARACWSSSGGCPTRTSATSYGGWLTMGTCCRCRCCSPASRCW
jgi:phosphatidylglycerol---prolipoprotein diacylglyceryl transferase